MKKILFIAMVAMAVLQVSQQAVLARGGHHSHVGVDLWLGPGFWGPYPYYPYYVPPPVIVRPEPEVYVQPAPVTPQSTSPQQDDNNYWYYCPDSNSYYPYVQRCPSGWLKVVPSPPPAN